MHIQNFYRDFVDLLLSELSIWQLAQEKKKSVRLEKKKSSSPRTNIGDSSEDIKKQNQTKNIAEKGPVGNPRMDQTPESLFRFRFTAS